LWLALVIAASMSLMGSEVMGQLLFVTSWP